MWIAILATAAIFNGWYLNGKIWVVVLQTPLELTLLLSSAENCFDVVHVDVAFSENDMSKQINNINNE